MPFKRNHFHGRYISWLNDPDIVRFSEQRHEKHTRKSCQKYIKTFTKTKNQLLAIEVNKNRFHIGNISITRNPNNASADIGILIGEKNEWGKGYGSEAVGLALKKLLQDSTIRKITIGAMAENKAMIKLARNCGMKNEARISKYFLWNGKEVDLVTMVKYNPKFYQDKS